MKIAALGIGSRHERPVSQAVYLPEHEGTVALSNQGATPCARVQPSYPQALPAPSRVDVLESIDAAADDWAAFEPTAAGTLFQSLLWCRAWCDTIGNDRKVAVRIAMVRDDHGKLQAILPLQIRRRSGVRVLEWLTTPHASYGYGLFSRPILTQSQAWFEAVWPRVLERLGGYDAIALREMPERMFGASHPFTAIFNVKDANPSFAMHLEPDFEAIHAAKRKGEDRRANRKKEEALAKMGGLAFGLPPSRETLHETLDTMFRHQQARLAERGVHGTFGPLERQFIHRLADLQDPENPVLAPYNLVCGGEVLAVMMGGLHGGTFWALISSLSPGAIRKYSPGDVALRRTIRACCESGLETLDFSAGDSPYKRAWADDVIQLHNSLGARTLLGLAWASSTALRITVKRQIKTSPILTELAFRLRRTLFGQRKD